MRKFAQLDANGIVRAEVEMLKAPTEIPSNWVEVTGRDETSIDKQYDRAKDVFVVPEIPRTYRDDLLEKPRNQWTLEDIATWLAGPRE